MKILAWMLTRMILIRFALILFGISAFVLTLDLISYADDVLELKNNEASAIGQYVMLRLPGVVATFMSISLLLALLLALIELSYRNEVPALWSAGLSPVRIVLMLMPFGLLVGGINFLIHDQAVPKAAPVLHAWGIGDYGTKQLNVSDKDPIWMRAGNDILRAADSNPGATELDDVIIFRRDDKGILLEQLMAADAQLVNDRWVLNDVVIYYKENVLPHRVARYVYSRNMRPAAAGARSGDPEEMSVSDLDYFIANSGFGIRPAHVYSTWWHKRMSLFATACLMMAICLPLAVRFRRGGNVGMLFGLGVAIGFAFFIFEGLSLTLGELGLVPPWMSAWTPVILFAGLAATLTFRAETLD